jgi:hypothetical protein
VRVHSCCKWRGHPVRNPHASYAAVVNERMREGRTPIARRATFPRSLMRTMLARVGSAILPFHVKRLKQLAGFHVDSSRSPSFLCANNGYQPGYS